MIRKLKREDRGQLEVIVKNINQFNKEEFDVAMELIDVAINNPEQKDYNIFVFEEDEKVLGYHCTGKRYLTAGTFDLYWIAVHPEAKGKGIGSKLLIHAENFVKENNGSLLLAETSSKDDYDSTRKFYENKNYKVLAEIKNFYSENDHLVIFGKYFN